MWFHTVNKTHSGRRLVCLCSLKCITPKICNSGYIHAILTMDTKGSDKIIHLLETYDFRDLRTYSIFNIAMATQKYPHALISYRNALSIARAFDQKPGKSTKMLHSIFQLSQNLSIHKD